jgi:hypothetical protein
VRVAPLLSPILGLAVLAVAPTAARATTVFTATGPATVSGPPYPTAPLSFDVVEIHPGPVQIPLETIALGLATAQDAAGAPLPISVEKQPGPVGSPVIDWKQPGPAGFPATTFFDVFVALGPLGGGTPLLRQPGPIGFPAGPSFDVFFDTDLAGIGTEHHQLHFEIGAGQPLEFTAGSVAENAGGLGFDITFGLKQPGPIGEPDSSLPLFSATLTGSLAEVPEPSTLALVLVGVGGFAARGNRRRSR